MPRKIGFSVLSSSGHEENFSAQELLVHAPTASGWRSARFCSYPQQITLQLVERSRVRKLQLLAHQYLISAKVEFHVGDSLPDPDPDPARQAGSPGPLHRLGYVSLSDNERTGFKARELKSVHVNAVGTYLRVTLHRNHANRYNYYNQVALVAINVVGDSLDANAFNTIPSREQLIEHYLHSTQLDAALDGTHTGKCESISLLDDLAFDMYQDPEVAHLIRLLDQRKQDAARQERYELAKALKQAIADLLKVGERLGRYDAEKRSATEKEDYDLAQRRKEQMAEYRRTVYEQLQVHNLLDLADVRPALTMSTAPSPSQESPSQLPSPGGQEEDRPGAQHQPPARPVGPPAAQPASSKPRRLTESLKKVKKAPLRRGGSERVATGARSASLASTDRSEGAGSQPQPDVPRIDVSSVPYDDRPLPVLRRTDGPGEVVSPRPAGEYAPPPGSSRSPGSSHTSPGLPGWTAEAGPLSDKAQREASLSVEVFGEGLVAGAYSKNWALRERALADVCEKLQGVAPGTSREERRTLVRAAVFLVKRALQDKLSPVFQAALRLLRLLLSQVIPSSGLGRAELSHCLEQTWPSLLARSWDPGRRVRATAAAYILDMAQWKEVRALQVVPSELSRPFKPSSPTRLALGRAELLETLLAELGTDHSGFTLENVMKFCGVALQHSAAEVREVAVRVVLSLYRTHSTAVLQHLPAGDAAARRSVLYKRLFDAFARMDGRVAGSQQKGDAGREDGEKEKEEIRSLQEQLAALKEMSEKDSAEGPAYEMGASSDDKEAPQAGTTEATKVFQNELSADEPPSGVGDLDNLCIFCGKSDESFTEDKLDLHYWKHCPMLRRCEECRQVVEIAGLTDHLLGECESRTRFSQCPRCSEALPAQELSRHAQGPACNPPAPGEDSHHCPLCHSNFLSGEEAWKAHLMGGQGCKQNSRRTVGSQRTQPAQGKAMGGARLRQAWSDGARSKAVNRTSRIPALAPRTTRPQAGRTRPGKRWPPS